MAEGGNPAENVQYKNPFDDDEDEDDDEGDVSSEFFFPGENPNVCNICAITFKTFEELQLHQGQHANEKPYKCMVCQKAFKDPYNFKYHINLHTGENLFKCDKCTKMFTSAYGLREHSISHIEEKLFHCDICSKKFKGPKYLKKHMKRHENKQEPQLKCEQCSKCDKFFFTAEELAEHLESNDCRNVSDSESEMGSEVTSPAATKEAIIDAKGNTSLTSVVYVDTKKLHRCNLCQKTFKKLYGVKRHLTTHANRKPFRCEYCNKSFKHVDNLRFHLKSHEDALAKFECDQCPLTFASQAKLKVHHVTHATEKPFTCGVCFKQFKASGSLGMHYNKKHGKRVKKRGMTLRRKRKPPSEEEDDDEDEPSAEDEDDDDDDDTPLNYLKTEVVIKDDPDEMEQANN